MKRSPISVGTRKVFAASTIGAHPAWPYGDMEKRRGRLVDPEAYA